MNKKLIENFILLVSGMTQKEDLLQEVVLFLKNKTNTTSVGIRLQEGQDYPYYTTLGFSDHFIKAENFLCKRDECGKVIRDENGNPILECMCGAVIGQKTDPNKRYFTKCGSFNLSDTNPETITDIKENNCMVRGRCLQEGYKSVAVIPIPYENIIVGSIQLNNLEEGHFSSELIGTIEEIAKIIGRALGGIVKFEEEKTERKKAFKKNLRVIISDLQQTSKELLEKHRME
jgi:hypothetical protein